MLEPKKLLLIKKVSSVSSSTLIETSSDGRVPWKTMAVMFTHYYGNTKQLKHDVTDAHLDLLLKYISNEKYPKSVHDIQAAHLWLEKFTEHKELQAQRKANRMGTRTTLPGLSSIDDTPTNPIVASKSSSSSTSK